MPIFKLDGSVIRVPHIPANVNIGISDHCLKSESTEIRIAFLLTFVRFLRIYSAPNDINQFAAFANKLLANVGLATHSSLQGLVSEDSSVVKLTTGWEEKPFALSYENCIPPVVHVTRR